MFETRSVIIFILFFLFSSFTICSFADPPLHSKEESPPVDGISQLSENLQREGEQGPQMLPEIVEEAMEIMIRFTPKIITVLQEGYSLQGVKSDLIAGLTVAVVALPLAMALGIASGATPEQGIVTAIVAGFIISLLGGSRVQIGGPTGAFVVIIHDVIARYGYDGLLLSTIFAGIFLIFAGYAQLGQLIRYIPQPVITGFTSGVAVIIASTQLENFTGMKSASIFQGGAMELVEAISFSPLAVGMATLLLILSVKKYFPKSPSFLFGLVASSTAVYIFDVEVDTVATQFPEITAGFPPLAIPHFSLVKLQEVLPSAFTIAFLAGVEALLSATIADGMTGFKHRPNQELVAQGIANIASSLFGGVPATGAIARGVTNITSGGRTPFAGIFHALFLLLFILLAAGSMKIVPMPSLAAILLVVAWNMSEAERFIRTMRFRGNDKFVLLLTFFLTIFVDLTVAIGVGVTLSSLLFVADMSRSVEISSNFGSDREEEYQRGELPKGVEVFTIAGPIFFGIASDIPDLLKNITVPPKILIIRMKLVPFLDSSGVSALDALVVQCYKKEIEVIFSATKKQPKSMLSQFEKSPYWQRVSFCDNYETALALSRQGTGH